MDRISTAFDIRYFCNVCSTDHLDRSAGVNERVWTCKSCDSPVFILLADQAGNNYVVERCRADQLRVGDLIVREYALNGGAVEILESIMAFGKGNKWHLAMKGVGSERVDIARYFNRIP